MRSGPREQTESVSNETPPRNEPPPSNETPPSDEPPPTARFGDERLTARLLVAAQVVLLAVLAAHPRRSHPALPGALRGLGTAGILAGAALAGVGATSLGRGLTALPLPNEHATLRTGGLYRFVRHPIYAGVLMAAVSRTVVLGRPYAVVATSALVVLLHGKARFEERHLAARFPGYDEYAARTPRLVPRLWTNHSL